jgi:hypothetical protein
VIFGPSVAAGQQTNLSFPAGKYIAFYAITNSTRENFLSSNPSNNTNGGPVALLSYAAANPNQISHFRWFGTDGVASDGSKLTLHVMDRVFGDESMFDDLALDLTGTPSG